MSAVWDDEPGPLHAESCLIHRSDRPCTCGAELERLRGIEAAAVALAVKVEQHQRRGWDHIRVGAFDRLRAALDVAHPADLAQAGYADHRGGYPLDDPMDALLRPEAGSLADRLERLARTLPCDGEAS